MHGNRSPRRLERWPQRHRNFERRSVLLLCAMLIIASFGSAAAGVRQLIRPEARHGFEVRAGEGLEMAPLLIERAPRLPSWAPHGTLAKDAAPDTKGDGAFEEVLMSALAQSVAEVNRHLPTPVRGRFSIWVFDRVPYAAKALDDETVVLARRMVGEERYRAQLPCVIAHELHHLTLMRAGFNQLARTREETVLAGLMLEGIPTWMCVASGRFPEMAARLADERALATAFDEVRDLLHAPTGAGSTGGGVFREHKAGYEVGAWMVSRIEQTFGRERWLELLREPVVDPFRRFLKTYLATAPPPEFQL